MKLKNILAVILIAVISLFSSCKKCMECSYKTLDGVIIEEEKCGTSDELADFEAALQIESNKHRNPVNCSHSR